MSNFVAVKNRRGIFTHYKVPQPVAVYLKQLEVAIHLRRFEDLEKAYPERFNEHSTSWWRETHETRHHSQRR